jgi:hypothetical protein
MSFSPCGSVLLVGEDWLTGAAGRLIPTVLVSQLR